MGSSPKYPDPHIQHTIIDPLLNFRHKVSPLNQTHNQNIQDFTRTMMGLLIGSDGEIAMQGSGADALATLVGNFLNIENQLAGTDPLALAGRLLDAANICENHAHNLEDILNGQASTRPNAPFASLLDGIGGDGEDDDPEADDAFGELGLFQNDMAVPSNEPLTDPPDINAMPANQIPNPSLGPNSGFIQSLGIDPPADPADTGQNPTDPFAEDVDNAIDRVKQEPNRVHHIFENPTHDHMWNATGLDEDGNWNLIRQTMFDNQDIINTTPPGTPGQVTTSFGTYTVVVRYIILNGVLRIVDAWVTVP